ncbi:putative olfactory ionotropic receptor IR4-like 11 [Homarus americanus]|uniref:Putative olfactory ionotropic receptor IR4-like 11 n=2 Tax=Homarus americanus TaxID=6706 RepID=A0A8J5JQT8_HOMAM|nr:putative olfactory ionotropic receptor IR4-like 11 [Homarus americanus]
MVSVLTPLFILVFIAILTMAQLKAPKMESESLSLANEVVEAVMSRVSMLHCTVLFFTDATTSSTTFFNVINHLRASRGVGVFEAASNGHDKNKTLFRLMSEARRLRQISLCVTVAVVSDDSAFLAAFAEWSLKGRLLQWSTRLLAVTRLPLSDLHHLHEFFSINNAMLLIMENNFGKLK